MAASYDAAATGYEQAALRFAPFVAARLAAWIKPLAGARVLDVGTGTGYLAEALVQYLRPAGRIQAIDVSERMLARLQEKLVRRGWTDIDTFVMDAQALEFRSDYFDLVAASLVLGELADPEAALRAWMRSTRPGGTIAATTLAHTSFTPCATICAVS